MCGIAGFLAGAGVPQRGMQDSCAQGMADALRHRGPDAGGLWTDTSAGVALAHRRLSILELSAAGSQPMRSAGGQFVMVFNGEIYNHLDLRSRLGERPWRGHSDTETLLAAIETWGVDVALRSVVGMFAFALWDRAERCLILARDRLGEKPLYFGWQGGLLLFSSELKALAAHPAWQGEVDRVALAHFMRRGFVPVPYSIWKGIHKLWPGSYLTLPAGTAAGFLPEPVYYWRVRDIARADAGREPDASMATDALEGHLRNAVGGQMLADVPLGAFLSGGVDSSMVVALMQEQSVRPVRTFSIGFAESDYNEADYARAVATHLGTDHTELRLAADDALSVIPRLPEIYDEPFGDSSQIPTYLVAELARRQVTVCLSGDGGDELFGGYNRYVFGPVIWNRLKLLPVPLRSVLGRLLHVVRPDAWASLGRHLPTAMRIPAMGSQIHKLGDVAGAKDEGDFFYRLVCQQKEVESIVLGHGVGMTNWADSEMAMLGDLGFADRMMCHDLVSYLTDDIMVKVDRAAMAVSLETRMPLLDHRLVEFAASLPLSLKIRHGQGKWLLREVLYRRVPRQLIERPKQGFAIPIESWLRGPLREWAEDLLDENRLRDEGYLRPEPVRQRWSEHLSGQRNWQHWLWNVLMFQAWRERWA